MPSRNIGVVLITAFFLVTLLFIVLYSISDQAREPDTPSISSGSDSAPEAPHGEDGQPPETEVEPTPDPPGGYEQGDTENGPAEDPDDDPGEDPAEDPAAETPSGDRKVAYLTFDDGPIRDITDEILDVLLREEIKATFFILPSQGVDDLFKRIIDEGHEVGNHSYTHVYSKLYESGADEFRSDVRRAHDFIKDNFGYTMTSFRFPGGFMRAGDGFNSRHDIIKELGYRHIHWIVDPQDWKRSSSASDIRKEVLDQIKALGREQREHAVILLHDYVHSQATVAALPGIIADLREQGYEFDIVRNYPANLRTGFGSRT